MRTKTVKERLGAGVAALAVATALGGAGFALADDTATSLPTGEYAADNYDELVDKTYSGETRLYIVGAQLPNNTNEGSDVDSLQMRVSVPVGIHFAAMQNGRLIGPSDGTVVFQNRGSAAAVHVAGIQVEAADGVTIAESSMVKSGSAADTVWMTFLSHPGTIDDEGKFTQKYITGYSPKPEQLGTFVSSEPVAPANKLSWDIDAGGAVSVDSFIGRITSFEKLNPLEDSEFGTIHWLLRLGTRAEAAQRDSEVTLHFHLNGGSLMDGASLTEQRIAVLDADVLPEIVPLDESEVDAIVSGEQVLEKIAFDAAGNVTYGVFEGWYLDADGDDPVTSVSDLGSFEDIAGKTFTLYAGYEQVDPDEEG